MIIHAYLVTLYAILLIVGGVMGFIKAGSVVSLAMGCLFGVLLLGCAVALYKQKIAGYWLALLLTILLLVVFCFRYLKSGVMIPSGLMAIVSLLMIVRLLAVRTSRTG